MNDYLRAVTLGAFTWRNEDRICLFFASIKKAGVSWLLLHFLLLAICLNFPITLSVARLEPYELFSRLYGENLDAFVASFTEAGAAGGSASVIEKDDFNLLMIESGYGANTLMPLLTFAFGIVLVLQVIFYLFFAFFLGLSRMNMTPLSFRDRMGLVIFSSTLPAFATTLLGLFIPGVHLIIFYFAVMFLAFQRSKLCPEAL
jgi:maltodextrin utilization protein YvdJ